MRDYLRDPQEIYRRSFALIRHETDFGSLPDDLVDLAARLVHACGTSDVIADLVASPGAAKSGRAALAAGASVLCDVGMTAHGVIRRRLPAHNEVLCWIDASETRQRAERERATRAAAAVAAWRPHLAGAVVAIGNAPTALFRLLEELDAGAPRPALILAFPVGFVGAAEAKDELIANSRGVPFIALRGRRGGSALAAAAVNALAASGDDEG